jgi:energy-coupling factor transport system ATP-binding protein
MSLHGVDYEPARTGNRAIALATQNPDHQWCGATLREDIARRRSALAARAMTALPSDDRIALLAGQLGFSSLDLHLYELPLAARKRLSWLWPLAGALPWIMLDEPTIGQDRETRAGLAAVIKRLCALGYGVIFVTHDDDFASQIPHRTLAIGDMKIRSS